MQRKIVRNGTVRNGTVRNGTVRNGTVRNGTVERSRKNGFVGGKWSRKYKKSINCNKPKGFSQKQHCKYGIK